MRIERKSFLTHAEHGIALTEGERSTLRRASRIAERIRELCREVNPDYEDASYDTDLAEIEHNCRDLSESGWVVAREEDTSIGFVRPIR